MDFMKNKKKTATNSWATWHINFSVLSTFQLIKGNLYMSDQVSHFESYYYSIPSVLL